ncbi:MAG: hypothetical protein LH645_12270, partial [Actinomycetia bacterium]|nr:hypothetical protein [Actinomycetes bacterium]
MLLPVLSVLVVLGAIGLAAWMLLTSGDKPEQADPTPNITGPTVQPSGTASAEPTKNDNQGGTKNDNQGGTKNDNQGGTKNDNQ